MHIHRVPSKTRMARATYNREILAHTQIQIVKMEEWVKRTKECNRYGGNSC